MELAGGQAYLINKPLATELKMAHATFHWLVPVDDQLSTIEER